MILLIGFLFIILMLCFAGIGMSTIWVFVDTPSFILIAAPLIFFMTVTKTYKSIGNYFTHSFKENYHFSKYELECLSQDLGAIIKVVLASGAFGFISGFICLLTNLNPDSIGPNLGVSLITGLYSIIFSFFIFYPLKIWAELELRELNKTSQEDVL